MNRQQQIMFEVQQLNMLNIQTKLIDFLKTEYDLTSAVEKFNSYLDIFLSNVQHTKEVELQKGEDTIATSILKFFNKQDFGIKAENVWPTEYGYTIVFNEEEVFEDKIKNESVMYHYYYGQQTIDNQNESNHSLAEARKKLTETRLKLENENEEEILDDIVKPTSSDKVVEVVEDETIIDKKDIEETTSKSNLILDDSYIWIFTILNKNGDIIEDDILTIDEAIESAADHEAEMIVAYPYTDPNPEDVNVDLVFADNPGPIIVYDAEQAVREKGDL